MEWVGLMVAAFIVVGLRGSMRPRATTAAVVVIAAVALALWYLQIARA
ncbi:MAG TPA: hypothetical protein VFD01_07690 [Candidatus Dormibacteraeota bacterium]|nr:hypothetical protein [Candidatus Dormibacteraeota bacterium]